MGLFSRLPLFLLSIIIFTSLWQTSTFAAHQSYIVYMRPNSDEADSSLFDAEKVTKQNFDTLESLLESPEKVHDQMIYSYKSGLNGFAAVLDDSQVTALRDNPSVLEIFPNTERKLLTTHSWKFLGLEGSNGAPSRSSLWQKAKYGEGVIIGNIDTGVWPESPSFDDSGMGPVPKRWKGVCMTEGDIRCNRKLIGARYFVKGYAAENGPLNQSLVHARDFEGHGSHTLSTAGGSFVPGANIFGLGNGTAKGGSPKAHVAAYKACWPSLNGGCYDADILAALDAAIDDGVDVISISIGGPPEEFALDAIAFGTFQAIKKGVSVIISAGNGGPDSSTVLNVAPWMFTIGASTLDRQFTSIVTLGNKKHYKGESLSEKSLPPGKFYPLINSADARLPNASLGDAQLCAMGSLDQQKVTGKIVVCLRGENERGDEGNVAADAGAVGMIMANDGAKGNDLAASPHVLPASNIKFSDSEAVFDYIRTTKNPVASIGPAQTELPVRPAPVMASFTSRGPNPLDLAILKPDVTAPGVDVIAAYSQTIGQFYISNDNRTFPYMTMSGTSMSCPHVAGIVALLKAIHPTWSPAAIKSAIMTTAKTRANDQKAILDATLKPANPFAYGAGHVQPNHAADPGLVYDLTTNDYLNYLCTRGYNQTLFSVFADRPYTCPQGFTVADFNYPSISVPDLNQTVTITRRVKNVGSPGTYKAIVNVPAVLSVVVEPQILTFNKPEEEKIFKVVVKSNVVGQPKHFVFGQLIWSDGRHRVKSPIVVKHK